jgi:hypothetical protein
MACEVNIYQNPQIFINDFEKRLKKRWKIFTIQCDLSEIIEIFYRKYKK